MIGVRSTRKLFLYPGEEVKPSREPKLKLHGATKHAVETGRMRLVATAGLFGVAFLMIGLRLVDLMVFDDRSPAAIARPHAPTRPSTARADIVDRNGIIVATNLPTVNLYADAHEVPDAKQAADKLTATLADVKYDDVLRRLSSGQRFIYLRRNLTPEEQMAVNRLGIPGVYFEDSESRAYLHSSLFAHVVGNTDPDNHGVAGIEKTFDEILSERQEPLMLSLDVRVQHAVHESLAAALIRFRAAAGSAVVMDVNSGEVLGMVSLPDYDPKLMGGASVDARFNRSTLGLYEMGSAFKLFTTAMALENGTANLTSTYDASEPIKIGRFTIKDFHGLNRRVSVPEIMVHSSNIGAAKMALEAGTDVQKSYLKKFGLLSPLHLELPEVGTPQYPSTWRDINTITISYGHGITVTPIHMAAGVSALVNGGTLYPPTLLHHAANARPAGNRVISAKTSDVMRALMRMVVVAPGGTGSRADAKGYFVGGKTGSAEKVSRHGGYSKSSNRTVFVATFPIDAPRYVVFVLLDEPRGIKETNYLTTAGWNAVPTVGNIISKIGPMLGVFPIGHNDAFQPFTSLMEIYAKAGDKDEHAVPTLVKATIPARTEDPYYETTAEEPEPTDDSIGGLIGDLRAENSGGGGEAQ